MHEALAEKRKQHAKYLERVEWLGKTLEVSNEKLRLSLIEAQEAEIELKAAQAKAQLPQEDSSDDSSFVADSLFSSVIGSYDEAIQVIRDDMKQLAETGAKGSEKVAAQQANLMALRDYAQFNKVQAFFSRNLQLANQMASWLRYQDSGSKSKPPAQVRNTLYAHKQL